MDEHANEHIEHPASDETESHPIAVGDNAGEDQGELSTDRSSSRAGWVHSPPKSPPRSRPATSEPQPRAVAASTYGSRPQSAGMEVRHTMTEQVDVAIVGAGLCGLACAAALHRVRPDCVVKVYERRRNPMPENTGEGDGLVEEPELLIGGGARLEANGLKALTAISRKVTAAVMSEGLYAQQVLLHDTETGTVITHLQEHPHLSSPSPRQPSLVVGWSELEQLLLDQLPPDTVQWGAITTSYTDIASQASVQLEVVVPKQEVVGPGSVDGSMYAGNGDGAQQHHRLGMQPNSTAAAGVGAGGGGFVSPFQSAARAPESTAAAFSSRSSSGNGRDVDRSGIRPHRLSPEAISNTTAAAGGGGGGSNAGGRADSTAAAAAAGGAGVGETVEVERVLVQARLVIAADGPLSVLRQQLAGDGPPMFDGTVRWVGRLPGDLLSTIPVAHEAWWLAPGMTFNSHPLRCGDVVWEAQVNSSSLAAAGLRWDPASHSLIPINRPQDQSGTGPDNSLAPGPDNQAQPGSHQAARYPQDLSKDTSSSTSTSKEGSSLIGPDKRAAAAAAPAGEMEAGDAEVVAAAARDAAAGAGAAVAAPASTQPQGKLPAQALLHHLFASFPAAVLDMISATPASCVLEAAVYTRPARLLPASLGRGGVAVLGQAACPLRPVGQECSQALEDAAELGAAVMACGISREALRRLELRRRPRWRHAMQVSQALGSVSSLGGVSLHQGLLDYIGQLHNTSFVPLRTIKQHRTSKSKQLLRLAGYTLLLWGTAAGVGGLVQQARGDAGGSRKGQNSGPIGQVLAGVGEAGEAAGKVLNGVASAAVKVPGQLVQVVPFVGKSEKNLEEGIGNVVHAVAEIADETVGKGGDTSDSGHCGSKVVYGQVPGAKGSAPVRFKDAVFGRVMSVGAVVSKPFARILRHRVAHQVSKDLGVF